MKKVVLAALITLSTTALCARELAVFPIATDADYCLGAGVALLGGYGNYTKGEASAMYGVEFSMACPLLQLETLDIKQQISLVNYSFNGLNTLSLEFNPHLMFDINNKLQFGVGPGFGILLANPENGDSATSLTVALGASLNYNVTRTMYLGLESRYQWVEKAEFATDVKTNLDNHRTLLKVGMHF